MTTPNATELLISIKGRTVNNTCAIEIIYVNTRT